MSALAGNVEKGNVFQGSLKYPFGWAQTMQMYLKFEGFPRNMVHCLGWSYNDHGFFSVFFSLPPTLRFCQSKFREFGGTKVHTPKRKIAKEAKEVEQKKPFRVQC